MIRIVLIEDEPSSTRFLTSIIERKCPGFQIVGAADNGTDGLEKVRQLRPDLLITDIRMPGVDGIELVSRVREELPGVYSVIVSGYQDFEYARRALHSGVVDYLLKPVNSAQLAALLESIGRKVERDTRAARVELFKKAIDELPLETWRREKYLPFGTYAAALVRHGGLPSRFGVSPGARDRLREPGPGGAEAEDAVWIIQGRDDRELIFLHSPELAAADKFAAGVESAARARPGGFSTVVFSPGTFPLHELRHTVSLLCRSLDSAIVLGLTQVRRGAESVPATGEGAAVLDGASASRVEFLLSNSLFSELEEELRTRFSSWERERRPQAWVETYLRQVFHLVLKWSPAGAVEAGDDFEFLLDDALRTAESFGELAENAWSLVRRLTRCPDPSQRSDAPALLGSVEHYLSNNYAQPISLRAVCDAFGVSQTYLSRLFRKHENRSFNEYLTLVRVRIAKKLMADNPGMPLKDVAAFVGYHDQFYFSRVFKSIEGIPPSEYLRAGDPRQP
jgi:DNA-binding NarL/FixJ family response regulator/AraC-like DNA-binding protein